MLRTARGLCYRRTANPIQPKSELQFEYYTHSLQNNIALWQEVGPQDHKYLIVKVANFNDIFLERFSLKCLGTVRMTARRHIFGTFLSEMSRDSQKTARSY